MQLSSNKKIYFASDQHFGAPTAELSFPREQKFVSWLDEIKGDAEALFLLGDLFDFWFEYKTVIPKGFVRLQAKIAELTEKGIPIHFFKGNHDMWMFTYFQKELGVQLHSEPVEREFNGKRFFIGHGDGLGPGDYNYKLLKKVFTSKVCQWLFARIHPNLGIGLAHAWSQKSRLVHDKKEQFLGEENEWLAIYAKEKLKHSHYDYFIFGHRHIPLNIDLGNNSKYINLGEWIHSNTYACFDGKELSLLTFNENEKA
jgi:UDP-2,3-diacylglucosamine hydrolase